MTDAINSHSRRMYNAQKKTPSDLSTPLDDPRVAALVEALKEAERMLKHYGSRDAGGMAQIRAALSALEENK
jgi:hypothetical protein